jgi:DNA invertase Pin-like site-specific DNA recombinase
MDTQKRAWIYTRIDAPEDAHGMLKKQEKELIEYAEQLGLSVVGGSSDIGSGMNMNRPGLAEVTAAAGQGKIDVLLIKNLSRIGRNSAVVTAFLSELALLDVEALSPLEGKIDIEMLSKRFSVMKAEEQEMGGIAHA